MEGYRVTLTLRDGRYYTWDGDKEIEVLDLGDVAVLARANVFTAATTLANPLTLTGLPTTNPGVVGRVWDNLGVLNISAG